MSFKLINRLAWVIPSLVVVAIAALGIGFAFVDHTVSLIEMVATIVITITLQFLCMLTVAVAHTKYQVILAISSVALAGIWLLGGVYVAWGQGKYESIVLPGAIASLILGALLLPKMFIEQDRKLKVHYRQTFIGLSVLTSISLVVALL